MLFLFVHFFLGYLCRIPIPSSTAPETSSPLMAFWTVVFLNPFCISVKSFQLLIHSPEEAGSQGKQAHTPMHALTYTEAEIGITSSHQLVVGTHGDRGTMQNPTSWLMASAGIAAVKQTFVSDYECGESAMTSTSKEDVSLFYLWTGYEKKEKPCGCYR